jgi:hypothetical protein
MEGLKKNTNPEDNRMPKSTVTHRQRMQRDERIRKAFLAGVPAAMIARRRGKSTRWVHKRLEAMGCPASAIRRMRSESNPAQPTPE